MAFQFMAQAVKADLPTNEKFLLLMLANYADENGRCFPSVARLQKDTGIGRSTIFRCLASLEKKGAITREQRTQDGIKQTTIYTFAVVPEGDLVVPERDQGSATAGRGVVPQRDIEPVRSNLPTKQHSATSLRSVAGASAGELFGDGKSIDPWKPVYQLGKDLLGRYGIKSAGAIITRWKKHHGHAEIMNALQAAGACERENIVEYISGCLRNPDGHFVSQTERELKLLKRITDGEFNHVFEREAARDRAREQSSDRALEGPADQGGRRRSEGNGGLRRIGSAAGG